jgi:hypothetical protein
MEGLKAQKVIPITEEEVKSRIEDLELNPYDTKCIRKVNMVYNVVTTEELTCKIKENAMTNEELEMRIKAYNEIEAVKQTKEDFINVQVKDVQMTEDEINDGLRKLGERVYIHDVIKYLDCSEEVGARVCKHQLMMKLTTDIVKSDDFILWWKAYGCHVCEFLQHKKKFDDVIYKTMYRGNSVYIVNRFNEESL